MRLVLCDARRSFLDATADGMVARGHEVLATSQDPDALPGLLTGFPGGTAADACVLDTTYDGALRLDALLRVFLTPGRHRVAVLTDHASTGVWQMVDDGMVQAVLAKTTTHDELDDALVAASGGHVVVAGHTRLPVLVPDDRPAGRYGALTGDQRRLVDLLADDRPTRAIARELGVPLGAARALVTALLVQVLPARDDAADGPG